MRALLLLCLLVTTIAQDLPKPAPADVELDASRFEAMEAAIKAGEFKRRKLSCQVGVAGNICVAGETKIQRARSGGRN
jgi:hypothetical protein